ncbi:MAG: MerR family transcriptional regulator [Rhizomicrobium sp.]
MDRDLSPSETARRLGVTVKALRLYEQHKLMAPRRTAAGWRVYGPAELSVLHRVIALKRLGLPLARIAGLMSGRGVGLDLVLALQEQALAREAEKTALALGLVRAARAKLARNEALTIDDLATLTTETTMTAKPGKDDMNAIFDPLIAKHYEPGDLEALKARAGDHDPDAIARQWDGLFAEARGLMAQGDPASPAAADLARRWAALTRQFTQGDPALGERAAKVWKDAMADPDAQAKLPMDPALWDFVGKAMAALKAEGGRGDL